MDSIEFVVAERSDRPGLVDVAPKINGAELADLVERFEQEARYTDPAGGYGGLVPAFQRPKLLEQLSAPGYTATPQELPVLGCICGEWACWPLLTTVSVEPSRVTWSRFRQPHRKTRDYSALGPFEFDRQQYEDALRDLAAHIGG